MNIQRLLLLSFCLTAPALTAAQDANYAQELANPLAALISMPIQTNYNEDFGLDEQGAVLKINVQPVVPFSMGPDWTLISRSILPILNYDDVPVPVNLMASQVMRFGNQLVQIGCGLRYWVTAPDAGPEDWALRLQFKLLFPK